MFLALTVQQLSHSEKTAADGVALHAAWVGGRHRLPGFRILTGDGQAEPQDGFQLKSVFGDEPARTGLVWILRATASCRRATFPDPR